MPKVRANGIDFYYERHGKGDPLILICGFTNHVGMWEKILPKLSDFFEVIVFDNRGAGRTDAPPPPYSIEGLADDVIALMDALDIQKSFFAGFSMGSLIVQSIGHRYGERIHKGVLIAPFSVLPSTALMQAHSISKLFQAGVEPALALETILPWIYSNNYLSDPKRVEKTITAMVESPYPQSPEGYQGQLEAISKCDLTDQLEHIETPLLILAGEEDLYIPFSDIKLMKNRLPQATLKGIPNIGHMPHIEAEDVVVEGIHAFCTR
ncbi:MAG: alpha/beta fold hydrolase [Chlamydiia bacterium]|nr:alpha/beta fold hydrolase [Chlamydiia bacterium]